MTALGMAGFADLCTHAFPASAAAPPGGRWHAVPPDAVELTGELRPTRTRVILLGTAAGPFPAPGRQGCSTLLVVGDRSYLVDAGYGTVRKFMQSGVPLNSLAAMFVTHMHSDHTADMFNLFLLGWGPQNDGIATPLRVLGPGDPGGLPLAPPGVTPAPLAAPSHPTPAVSDLLQRCVEGYAYDLNIRTRYNNRVGLAGLIEPHDLLPPDSSGAGPQGPFAPTVDPFPVYEDDRLRVTATLADHPPVYPSFAFRFETEDAVVVCSGDTAESDNVARLAEGANLLIHEVMNVDYYASIGYNDQLLAFLRESHTAPAGVGRVARAAGVRRLALSHIGPPDPRVVTDREWLKAIRRTFAGDVVVGHDLYQLAVPARRRGSAGRRRHHGSGILNSE